VSQTPAGRGNPAREALAAALLLLAGVGTRVVFAAAFPAQAFSDFRALIDFGMELSARGPAAPTWHWIQFNPGLPMILSVLGLAGRSPESAARLATAVATGLLPLLPFFLWRGVLALRWRFAAGALLALWPGQIFFSGVVAQENWALLPAVALGCFAVRALRLPGGAAYPIAAGLLLAAGVAIRQELLVVMAPAALAAAGLLSGVPQPVSGRRARVARFALAAGLSLLVLALQRQAATGRFALTTEHGGLALLGSVIPGAAGPGWVDPKAYLASVDPALLENRDEARRASTRLALAEWRRRPGFHVLRGAGASARLAVESDADDLYWSIGAPEALPAEKRARGAQVHARWFPRLRWELALIQGLFAAAVVVGLRRRDRAILVLAACVVLKFALQSVASPLGRLMLPATALELLAIVLALSRLSRSGWLKTAVLAVAVAIGLLLVEPRLSALAVSRDEPARPVRRFPLEVGPGQFARCTVEAGEVVSLEWRRVWLRPGPDGAPARVACEVPEDGEPLRLRLDETGGGSREHPLFDRGPDGRVTVELPTPGGISFRRGGGP
jgi:hypothetical protein